MSKMPGPVRLAPFDPERLPAERPERPDGVVMADDQGRGPTSRPPSAIGARRGRPPSVLATRSTSAAEAVEPAGDHRASPSSATCRGSATRARPADRSSSIIAVASRLDRVDQRLIHHGIMSISVRREGHRAERPRAGDPLGDRLDSEARAGRDGDGPVGREQGGSTRSSR